MKKNTATTVSVLVSLLLVGGALWFVTKDDTALLPSDGANITTENGTQIVDIAARGGYAPRRSVAKAGMPTVIRVETKGTYDCSAALSVPEAGFRGVLPSSGTTDIPLSPQEPGAVVRGVCSMGMYSFEVVFE
jgi:Cu+-exporting ATPase